jgi:hypothetical protein
MFFTEIEPINIVYKKHEPQLYELIRQLLAIVGGTVATIGIFNSFSHFLFNIKWSIKSVYKTHISFLFSLIKFLLFLFRNLVVMPIQIMLFLLKGLVNFKIWNVTLFYKSKLSNSYESEMKMMRAKQTLSHRKIPLS